MEFPDAESYLLAVVQGRVVADPLRLQAAKAILPYQQKKQRSPLTAKSPQQQQAAAEKTASRDINEKFKNRLAEIKRINGGNDGD
ncbi:hypothetical protein [Desulfurivibrio sp. C05AmB]|uniref:hypothetical protein n=1 Tax=Desulfurivibrio sp. C05AmB TaxID=3374371 RepID=UPI00376F3F28